MISHSTYCAGTENQSSLTGASMAAILAPLSQKTKVGSRNPYLPGDKTPQPIAAFLCLSFSAASCRIYSVMAGLFGQRSALAAPGSGFRPHLSPPPDTVESIDGGYSLLPGVTTMSHPNSAQNSEQTQPKTIHDLHEAFAELCYSYGMLGRNVSVERNNEALEEIIADCETLTDVSLALRLQAKGGVK